MALSGKYEFVKNEGFLEHLIATGLPEDRAKEFGASGSSLEITIDGDNVTITRGKGRDEKLVLNQEVTDKGPDGKSSQNLATLSGNQLTVTVKGERGELKRIYTLSGSELTVTSRSTKPGVPDGKRIYKKL